MAMQYLASLRSAHQTATVTALGGNATMRFYNGSRVAPASWTAGSPLATVTFGATSVTDANGGSAGGVVNGTLTFGGYTQTSSTFTTGTPTWVALVTSGGSCLMTIDIGAGAGNLTFTGSITNGQNITGPLAIAGGNA